MGQNCQNKKNTKTLIILFLIAFLIHFLVVLFIYYFNFQPFSGGRGDYTQYHSQAVEIARRVRQGNFSLGGIDIAHYYPVVVGYVYALTIPSKFMGQIFNAWIAALCAVLAYLIVLEMGASKKQGFFVGLIVALYPSLLFYGSLLLKDALVLFLSLVCLLFVIKLIKNFSLKHFLVFYITLGLLFHFRFYVAYALLLTFLFCWLIFSNLKIKKRLIYGFAVIILLGFLPQVVMNQGYYGINFIEDFLTPEKIIYYREQAYVSPEIKEVSEKEENVAIKEEENIEKKDIEKNLGSGQTSSFMVKTGFQDPFTFLKNSVISFTYSLLGPFPWQIRYSKQLFVLLEIIPWYIFFFFIVKGIVRNFKYYNYKLSLPLIVFSVIFLGTLSLFINNFGIITRIRMPAFISLLCFVPFGINWAGSNKIVRFIFKNLTFLTS